MTRPARSAADVLRQSTAAADLATLDQDIVECRACPRLVAWREQVARERRAAFRDEEYWGRPVPGFGSATPRILIVGLAPAAHGANRTGRVFTGDRSGDVLIAALHRAGLASQPTSTHADDGLVLHECRIVAAVRCAPPANDPTPQERSACSPWLQREWTLVAPQVRVVLCLGAIGWQAALRMLDAAGATLPRPRPRFGHRARVGVGDGDLNLLGCYHPSQQNTFTGRLTPTMLDEVLADARGLAGL